MFSNIFQKWSNDIFSFVKQIDIMILQWADKENFLLLGTCKNLLSLFVYTYVIFTNLSKFTL